MEKVVSIIILILYGVVMLLMCYIAIFQKEKNLKNNVQSKNNVHFYVARDSCGILYLYMGKPIRATSEFLSSDYGKLINSAKYFSKYGLNEDNYANLKWEDEPVEVFINMED